VPFHKAGENLDCTTTNPLIGTHIVVAVGADTDPGWAWSVTRPPGDAGTSAVRAYDLLPARGRKSLKPVPLDYQDLTARTLSLYFVQPGPCQITLTGSVGNGQTLTATATFNVIAPVPAVSVTDPGVKTSDDEGAVLHQEASGGNPAGWYLRLAAKGSDSGHAPPILKYSYSVRLPLAIKAPGIIFVTQLIERRVTRNREVLSGQDTKGAHWIDNCVVYDNKTTDANATLETQDTPEIRLVYSGTYTDHVSLWTYLMYQPPGGVPVALGEMTFSWGIRAVPEGDTWKGSNTEAPRFVWPVSLTDRLPVSSDLYLNTASAAC